MPLGWRFRSRCAVEVNGLGRTGSLLAQALAGAGVGTLVLSDPGVVLPSDVGPGDPLTAQGMRRAQAVNRHVYRVDPTVQVLLTTAPDPDAAATDPLLVDAVNVSAAPAGAHFRSNAATCAHKSNNVKKFLTMAKIANHHHVTSVEHCIVKS